MIVQNSTPFGPDSLIEWKGPAILTGGAPNYGALTKANATISWLDNAGNSYFGGNLSAGILRNAARSTSKALNVSVEAGPFSTNGGSKTVVWGCVWAGYYSDSTSGSDSTSTVAGGTVTLYRRLNGGSRVQLDTKNINTTLTTTVIQDPEVGTTKTLYEDGGATFTFTDTNTSTQDFTYEVEVTNQFRHLALQFITGQTTTVISTEE